MSRLHVAAVYFNHNGYRNIKDNFLRFAKHMRSLEGVVLHVVEIVLNNKDFEVTASCDIQLRTNYEFFHKENAINMAFANAIKQYPEESDYLAWIDADVYFTNPNIVKDTIDALNRYKVVQMWTNAIDLDPNFQPLGSISESFGSCFVRGASQEEKYDGTRWHPGYAWAIRRSTYEQMGGLYDLTIIGSGDFHMALAFSGQVLDEGVHSEVKGQGTANFRKQSKDKLSLIRKVVSQDLGCVRGSVIHHWHGAKTQRFYVDRWQLLMEAEFDPDRDLIRYKSGQNDLSGSNIKLRDGLRRYFAMRNDDCNVTPDFFNKQLIEGK